MAYAANIFTAPWDPFARRLRRSSPSPLVGGAQRNVEARDGAGDLAWLSLSAVDGTPDVDRDICRLALVSTNSDRDEWSTARRLM